MRGNFDSDFYRDGNRYDVPAAVAALVLTALLHVGAYCVVPDEFAHAAPESDDGELKLEILPPKLENRKPEFIEANPFGNDAVPDSPDAPESFKDQRAADEIPDPASKSRKPFVVGENTDSQKIVSGTSSDDDKYSPESVMQTLERPLERPAQPDEASAQQSGGGSPAAPQTSAEQPQQAQTAQADAQTSARSESEASEQDGASSGNPPENGGAQSGGDAAEPAQPSNAPKAEQSDSDADEKTPDDPDAFLKISKKPLTEKTTAKDSGKSDSAKSDARADASKPDKSDGGNAASQGAGNAQKKGAGKPSQSQARPPAQTSATPPTPQASQTPAPASAEEPLPAPRPRPTLSMKIPAGPLADNPTHASARGTVACDSRFSEFGAYQQRMIEAISRQWNLLASKYDLGTAVGTIVVAEYYLNSLGELTKFNIVFSNSTNTGSGLCEQSILTTAPYGEWTREMVAAFGNQEQSVRITFHYR